LKIVNIHEAKTHLSRLIESAVDGESFVIAKAGRPLVKVVALATGDGHQPRRLGFLTGQIAVPADFNTMPSHGPGNRIGDAG
jgi:prevent-host-death family protein